MNKSQRRPGIVYYALVFLGVVMLVIVLFRLLAPVLGQTIA